MGLSAPAASTSAAPAVLGRLTAARTTIDPRRARILGGRATVAALAALAAVLVLSRSVPSHEPRHLLLQVVIVGVPVVGGTFARRSPRTRRFGTTFVVVGLVWGLALLGESPYSLPYSVGRVAAWLIPPLVVYLMLIFPQGRLAPGRERKLFAAIAIAAGTLYGGSALWVEAYPLHTPWASCSAHCPDNAFLVLHHAPAIVTSVLPRVRETVAILLFGAVTVLLVLRVRSASPLGRRTLAPVAGAGVVATALLPVFFVVRQVAPDARVVETIGMAWGLSIAGIAAGFLVGLVRRRLLIADVLSRLTLALGSEIDPSRLRAALASALRDEMFDLHLWADDRNTWLSADPHRPDPPGGPGRATLQIDDGEAPVALLSFDEALSAADELLDAVGTQTRTALRRVRVTAQLEASHVELERSRSRIAAAAMQERARIERDLHDGAQQRLIALRVKLAIAEELFRTDPQAAAGKVHDLGPEIELALAEVRTLAHGIYPPVLADRGIEDALRSVVRASPLPAHLRAAGVTRHAPEIESALYFTCLEAVQNAAKHAHGASGVWIALDESSALSLEVCDDGAGFPPTPVGAGAGLRNMADRIDAVSGRLTIDSAPGGGTRVVASIPLG